MHKNFQIVCNKDPDYFIYDNNLIAYLKHLGYKLSFLYDNIFNFAKQSAKSIASQYYSNYKIDWDSAKRKFLCDVLLYENNKTPFCFTYHANNFIMTKGNNKLIACAVNNIQFAPILIVAKESVGYQIHTMDELYDILKMFDNNAEVFKIEIDDKTTFPSIHLIENEKTFYNWFTWDKKYANYITASQATLSSYLVLFGNVKADDNLINAVYDTSLIIDSNDFLKKSNNYPNFCNYFLYSSMPYSITLQYLNFNQYNLFRNKTIKVGFDKNGSDLILYNRNNNNGIIGYVNLPILNKCNDP